ncbi:cation:H+ antiporter [Methylohalomonas lacus]|uniref:Cation:H+ antiporter n=1 Tax=Methylohalomonas lacus TaxID=398773 RepID=A0AAE3L4H9_9GAMM|nr:sodium:calcium antiporter [Methylohalomonas lacus]MCS3903908.1 cation:H+ antiporter [Methylohalomonas lacus]
MFSTLGSSIVVFAIAAVIIAVTGVRLAQLADELADRTGWGEALMGGLFLAGITSLPDFAATLTAAVDGYAALAMGNVMGSLAVNLVFLCIGDIFYRKANLEHAAATSPNLIQAALFIGLLVIPLLAMVTVPVAVLGIHPITPLLVCSYILGYRLVQSSQYRPMWIPRRTSQTVVDQPDQAGNDNQRAGLRLWLVFALLALLIATSGWALMNAAETIASETALSESAVGTLFTAFFTSLPELVTTIAAVRYGALTLAVSNILGTNCFNILVFAAADIAYRDGSIYHAIGTPQLAWGLLTILMTAILLLGFICRERDGIGRIGFESFLILLLYAAAATITLLA